MVYPYLYLHLGFAQLAQAEQQSQPPSRVGAGEQPSPFEWGTFRLRHGDGLGSPQQDFWRLPLRSSSHLLMKSPEYSIRIIHELGKQKLQLSWVDEG